MDTCAAKNKHRAFHHADNRPERGSTARLPNVRRVQSFVVAIVPLRQIRFDFGNGSQLGERTGPPRPLHRAGEHAVESDSAEPFSQLARGLFTLFGQRNVRAAGVPAGQRPLGLAMSNEVQAWGHILSVHHSATHPSSGAGRA